MKKFTRLEPLAAVEIAVAHLFGLVRNLGLRQNANALALGALVRAQPRTRDIEFAALPDLQRVSELAAEELKERDTAQASAGGEATIRLAPRGLGPIQIQIAEPTVRLMQSLQSTGRDDAAQAALIEADRELDVWTKSRIRLPRDLKEEREEVTASFASGLTVTLSRELLRT